MEGNSNLHYSFGTFIVYIYIIIMDTKSQGGELDDK
jgi:hypothetical protein